MQIDPMAPIGDTSIIYDGLIGTNDAQYRVEKGRSANSFRAKRADRPFGLSYLKG
jgi:hypothetical protein